MTIGNAWIHSGNLTPFLRFVADRAKYELSEDEVEAIEFGVRSTDQEADRWFTYEFAGANSVNLWFAIDPGTSVTFWRAECPREMQSAIEAAAELMQQYRLDIQSKLGSDQSSAIDWLSSLTPKQFAEVFYAAAPKVSQRIVETESTQSQLVLTLMSRENDEQGGGQIGIR